MPYLTLTLNGQPVDLPPDAQVALSYRANDLRRLDSREAAFSEQFTLPRTARNAAVLGLPHLLDGLGTAPYDLLPAVLTSPGGTVLLDGVAVLERSAEGYDITLTDALGGLFVQVAERPLRAVNLRAHDHALTLANVQAAQANAPGAAYTYPLVNDGRLTLRYPDASLAVVHYTELPLAVFTRAVLAAVVADALPGYRLGGSLLADPLFRRHQLLGAALGPQRRPAYLAERTARARTVSPVVLTSPGVGTTTVQQLLSFPEAISDPSLRLELSRTPFTACRPKWPTTGWSCWPPSPSPARTSPRPGSRRARKS